MITPPLPPASSSPGDLDARSFCRAHAGKLMVVLHRDGRPASSSDFFRVENVSTHPTGLIVTGIFDDNRRGHLMASSLREPTASEIASRPAANNP